MTDATKLIKNFLHYDLKTNTIVEPVVFDDIVATGLLVTDGSDSLVFNETDGLVIEGAQIDNSPIGANTPSTGVFTSVKDTGLGLGIVHSDLFGNFSSSLIVNGDITTGTIANSKMANMAAHTIKGNNTGSSGAPIDLTLTQVSTELGLGTMASQNANSVAITGGTINGTTIGATTPSSAVVSSLRNTALGTGLVHANGTGVTSSSLLVNADITPGTITNASMANMAAHTFRGNNTGSSGVPLDLSIAQMQSELSVPTTIAAPVNATNSNVLTLAGNTIGTQFADGTHPGIVSITTQTFAGDKTFTGVVHTDVLKSATATAINIGGDATALNLTPTSGNMTIDQLTAASGSIFIGNTNTSTVQIGRPAITTTIYGIADVTNLDHGSALNIGTTNATSINFSKPGITSILNGIIDITNLDRAGAISIGPTNATSVAIGRAAITTTLNGTVDAQTIDRAGPIAIGGTNATVLNLGRAAITTNILGTTAITGGTINNTTLGATTPASAVVSSLRNTALTTGLVHSNGTGVTSSSLLVDADITPGTITNASQANMPAHTIKGNNTGSAAAPINLTLAQVSSELGLGTMASQNANAVAITGGTLTGVTTAFTTSGGTPVALDYYETETDTISVSGPWAAQNLTVRFARIGTIVIAKFENLSVVIANASQNITSGAGAIPSKYRPSSDTYATVPVVNGAAGTSMSNGEVRISSAGTLTITAPNFTTFGAIGQFAGIFACAMPYNLL